MSCPRCVGLQSTHAGDACPCLERIEDIEKAHKLALRQDSQVTDDGWLFFVSRPVAVIVKGTYGEAKAAQRQIEDRLLSEEYVRWFDDIPKVDRALMTEDPVEIMDRGRVEDY